MVTELTLITGAFGSGCNGIDDLDIFDGGPSWLFYPALSSGTVQELEALWKVLHVKAGRGVDNEIYAVAAQYGVILAPAVELPVWDETWQGTRHEWVSAKARAQNQLVDRREHLEAGLKVARQNLMRAYGGVIDYVHGAEGYLFVHDTGCRCGHRVTQSAYTPVCAQRVDGTLYLYDKELDAEATLAAADAVRRDAYTAAEAANETALLDFEQSLARSGDRLLLDDDARLLGMTYAQWKEESRIAADIMVTRVKDLVAQKDWVSINKILRLQFRQGLVDPEVVALQRYTAYLYNAGLFSQNDSVRMTIVRLTGKQK